MCQPSDSEESAEAALHAGFDQAGFLSEGVEAGRAHVRSKASDWFEFTNRLNIALQSYAGAAHEVAGTKLDPRTVAGRLMLRSASTFQGVVVLAERGMDLEARVLARTLLEHAFVLGAIHEEPHSTIELMIADANFSARKRIETVSKGTDFAEERPALIEALAQLPKTSQPLRPSDMSGRSPLGRLYLLYQTLSNDAAHPSLTSLERFASKDPAGWRYQWGPATSEQISDTLEHACTAAISAVIAYANLVEVPIDGTILRRVVDEFRTLQSR